MRRAFAWVALAGFTLFPFALGGQGIPDALKDKALVVRVTAVVPAAVTDPGTGSASENGGSSEKAQPWEAESAKYTVPGTPVPFKLVGSNVAILVQITPFELDDGKGVTLIAQGQVWVKPPQGGLSYHTTVETLTVDYGETVLFFPLGLDTDGNSSMRLEISVVHATDAYPESPGPGDKTNK